MTLIKFDCDLLELPGAPGGPQTGHGTVEVSEHGRVWVNIRLAPVGAPVGVSWPDVELALRGLTRDGLAVAASRAYLAGSEWNSETQEAVLRLESLDPIVLGQPAGAPAWTKKKLHLRNIDVLGPQAWTFDGLLFELRAMHRGQKLPERDQAGLVDFELTVVRQSPGAHPWGEVRSAVLKLLSLSARSRCSATIEETWDGDQRMGVELRTSNFDFHATHSLIPRESLGAFMGVVLPEYLANNASAGLDTLVSYYGRSHTDSMAEYKFLFAGVLMESLKFNWALNRRLLPTKKAASGVVQKFLKPDGKTAYSFEELLNMVAADLGVTAKYTFIENRNAVFHTGAAAAAQTQGASSIWTNLKPELVKLHDEIDDLLLSLLKYNGPITSYWDMAQSLQFPGRTPLP